MLQDEGLVVHAVEVITGKDDVLVALGLVEEPDVLAHSICGALEPVLVLGRLLRGEHLDETLAVVGADVVVVRLRKVSVERGGVELREAVHLVDVGVDAVGHGQVDEPVVGAKGNRGLGAGLGERIQAGARTTAEDDAEDIVGVVVDFGGGLSGDLSLGGDGTGHALHLGLRHDTAGRDGLTAHSLAGAELGGGDAGRESGRLDAHGDSLHFPWTGG
mmetsp:Transcript_8201/g.33153  ORF Transcript_8201/g.33153 Transcript_8201/m.33153 type:complete len:217 (+) Transcript_8201:1004-1654(+)